MPWECVHLKYQTVDQIREKFLDFFVEKKHLFIPSFPVVPVGDNSLLLINAGMTPMKPYFTGQQTPPNKRVTTCQKCIRTSDIEEVGKTERHLSFFEMLGNFSFGDYFKNEIIPWSWEFATLVMEMPVDKLYASVYLEDDEAYNIWRDTIGLPPERIVRLGKKDNFWEHGTGPCGPCSELHFDRGEALGCGKPDCAVGCDCDRFMEFWNLVFIQFNKDERGEYTPLPSPSIDTGMGLERMAVIMQGVGSVHEINTAVIVRDKVRGLAGITGEETPAQKIAVNIIADHIRCVVVMASDGVRPGSEGREYVLRRLLRRAVRYGRDIGLKKFVGEVVQTVIEVYGKAYPNLVEKSAHILQVLGTEEARFLETLETGLNLLQKMMDDLGKSSRTELNGADAFKLYDTYGFPPDITREILADMGLDFDQEGFDAEMQAQKDRARAARGTATYMGADETVYHKLPPNLPTEFVGYNHYESCECQGEILAIIADGLVAPEATEGQEVAVVLSKTPFYAASGGQMGDTGNFFSNREKVEINECIKVAGENIVHIGKVVSGTIRVGETVEAFINEANRLSIARNHTATHLLHRALKGILGEHVEQAGSEVTADRLRFDFTHHAPLTPKERRVLEDIINTLIGYQHPVTTTVTTPDEARKRGAIALFGEKYGETVRMVSIYDGKEDYSIELCGGTHVGNTVELGAFKLISESGIAAGVRRIEAATSTRAITLYREAADTVAELMALLKASQAELPARITALMAENKELKKEATRQQAEALKGKTEQTAAELLNAAEDYNGITLIAAKLPGYDIEALRQLSDRIKIGTFSGCLLLAGTNPETGAVQFLASATDDVVKRGIHAGNIVKTAATLCGGNGGGRPNHAQAGGKDAAKADEALALGLAQMKGMLN
jgi:alanyl-tRNA synthetase